MSVLTIPYGEVISLHTSVESRRRVNASVAYRFHESRSPLRNDIIHESGLRRWTTNRNETSATKFPSSTSCDPLLDFINLSGFEDNEVSRSVYDRFIPFNISKCDLLTKLFRNDRKPPENVRLCKQFPFTKPVKPAVNVKEKDDNFGGRILKPISIAEFVDIDEELRKYRKEFMREMKQRRMDSGTCGTSLDAVGRSHALRLRDYSDGRGTCLNTEGEAVGTVDDIRSDGEVSAEEKYTGNSEEMDSSCHKEVCDEERKAVDEELKFNPKHVKPKAHKKSCYSNRYNEGTRRNAFRNSLTITSNKKATKLTALLVEAKPGSMRGKIAKIHRPKSTPYRAATTPEITLEVAYKNKLTELREKTSELSDQDSLKEIFGKKFEKLEPNWINSVWFQTLVDEIEEKTESLRDFKPELTRAFRFSYFELLRKRERQD